MSDTKTKVDDSYSDDIFRWKLLCWSYFQKE